MPRSRTPKTLDAARPPARPRRALRRLASTSRRASREERGAATVFSIWMVALGLAFSGVAVMAATQTLGGSATDSSIKSALAAADSGAERAVFRHNKVSVSESLPCLAPNAQGDLEAVAALADGWCAEQTESVGSGTFRYRTKRELLPGPEKLARITVAAAGDLNGEQRRVLVTAESPTTGNPWGDDAVRSLNDIELEGNASVEGNAASNGNIELTGNSFICGDATPGPTGQVGLTSNAYICSGSSTSPASTKFVASAADPGTVHDGDNDNGRFFGQDIKTGSVSWNATTRVLTIKANETLTLGGDAYSLCQLEIEGNGALIVATGASPRIFFDSPENCGQSGSPTQLKVSGNGQIQNSNLTGVGLQVYMMGSASTTTKVSLAGNAAINQPVVIHAPRTEIDISGNGTYVGAVLGKEVKFSGNAVLAYDDDVGDLEIAVIPLYTRQGYVICRTEAGSTPDEHC